MVDRAAADASIYEADPGRPTGAPATACPAAVVRVSIVSFSRGCAARAKFWRDVARNKPWRSLPSEVIAKAGRCHAFADDLSS